MGSLLEKFAGKIDLIYIDPPFATGADFSFTAQLGRVKRCREEKHQSIEEKAYRDTWGEGLRFIPQMMRDAALLMRELLSESGMLYLHMWT